VKTPHIDFESGTHTYIVDGKEIPSVTTILKDVGIIHGYYAPGAAEKGKRKHKIFEAYLKGTLDWSALSEEEIKLLETFQGWYDKYVAKVIDIEKLVYNKDGHYAGTIDLIYENKFGQIDICDYKTGQPEKWHDLQLAAYYNTGEYNQAFKLYIKPNKYVYEVVEEIEYCTNIFNSARNIYGWKHGI